MKQKAISARINNEVLEYCKANGGKLNTLINQLLENWMKKNQEKQLLMFQEETGTDEFSCMAKNYNFKCSQCCNNCIHNTTDNMITCRKTKIISSIIRPITFCCIYWEKKKGGK